MSLFINSLLKISSNTSTHFLLPCWNLHLTQVRTLYSSVALGVDNYLQRRKKVKEQFVNFSDNFRTKMNEFVNDSKNMIFTEDLKNMVHLAEPTDLELVLNMIKKFNSQTSEYRFGSFVFGPVVMRMFHFLDAPVEALQCFEDPGNEGFFDQLVSFHILLDLLYTHQMYDDMFRVFEKIKEKQINMSKYPKYPVVLILAACYKQNTPQSLQYAAKLWTDMTSVGTVPVRRACTFFAALALNQGAPHVALESISSQKQHYVTIRNIKAAALADMGRVDDALPVLRAVLEIDAPEQKDKHTYFKDTILKVKQAVDKCENKDLKKEFENIEKALNDRNLIDSQQTLENLLNSEITTKKRDPQSMPFQGNKRMPFGMRQQRVNKVMS